MIDKEDILMAIEAIKKDDLELSWLEASTKWLEENGVNENMYMKVLPETVIESIKQEAMDNATIRPSMIKMNTSSTLDFLL